MFGRPRKLEDSRQRLSTLELDVERTVVARARRVPRRWFVPAAALAAMLGVASLIAVGVGTSYASTVSASVAGH